MIFFLLGILVCSDTSYTDCHWKRMGHYLVEDNCHLAGGKFMHDPKVKSYKCVIQVRDLG